MPPVSLAHDVPPPIDTASFGALPPVAPSFGAPAFANESESSVESAGDESSVAPPPRKRGRPAHASSSSSSQAEQPVTEAIAAAAASAAAAQFEATKEAKKRSATISPALKRKAMSQGPQRTQLTKAEVELGATLDLSRDELLNMTSDALEEYARRLAAQRPLTAEEQKRFKRQRRLIKNRESAQLSRLRKKAYVDELEREIAQLKEDRDAEQRRALAAERHVGAMQQENEYLRSLLAQHPTLASLAADRSQFAKPVEQPELQESAAAHDEAVGTRRGARRSAAQL